MRVLAQYWDSVMVCVIPEKLYGVIGWPLGQSLSPLLHNTGFQQLSIPAVYMAWPVEAAELANFINGMRLLKIAGCSVTIPHKIAVMPHLDNVSESAALAGAVNTLFWRGEALCGENTDVAGFLAPLAAIPIEGFEILILGAGGAARAVATGLRLRGCRHVRVTSPGNSHQFELAERFGFTPVLWAERHAVPAKLVINATPLGMTGKNVDVSPYDFGLVPHLNDGFAYDLVYNPLRTRFLAEAAQTGRKCISGLEMFFAQGDAQFKIWTGRHLPTDARGALKEALGQSGE